jgi:hypothetical protein
LKVDIIEDGSGVVDEVTITQTGTGYTIGDTFTLPGGNNDATIELTYVGIGDYRKFRGVPKLTAYWL